MAQTDNRSLQDIKRETEQTRAGLADTVDQLRTSVTDTANDIRARVSPAAIKAEVSDYIRSRGEQLMEDITAAARKNPLQAVAVGASVAYPLLRMARAIPAPILVLGAGLFLAGTKTGQDATQKASDMASDLSDDIMKQGRQLRETLEDTASAATSYATEKLGDLSNTVSNRTGQAGQALNDAGARLSAAPDRVQAGAASISSAAADSASRAGQQGMRMAGSAVETVKDAVTGATETGQRLLGDGRDAAIEAAKAVRGKASEFGNRAGKTVFATIEQNPVLVAGLGLLVGGLIASALPRSELEDDLVGETSSAVKWRARAAASDGLDTVKEAVGGAYQDVADRAQAEGLDPDGLATTARDIGGRMRRVVETAVTTAFDANQENSTSSQGDKKNG